MNAPQIPQDVPRNLAQYLTSLSRYIQGEFRSRTIDSAPRRSITLVSPNGSVYTVVVEDDGTLTTELVG